LLEEGLVIFGITFFSVTMPLFLLLVTDLTAFQLLFLGVGGGRKKRSDLLRKELERGIPSSPSSTFS
jgi:hypothetical protein